MFNHMLVYTPCIRITFDLWQTKVSCIKLYTLIYGIVLLMVLLHDVQSKEDKTISSFSFLHGYGDNMAFTKSINLTRFCARICGHFFLWRRDVSFATLADSKKATDWQRFILVFESCGPSSSILFAWSSRFAYQI